MKQSSYPQDIQCVHRNRDSQGLIYIGNIQAAKNPRILRKYAIKAVVSVAKGAFLNYSNDELPNYLYIPALDHESYPLDAYFEKTNDFIEKNLKRTNVLVHCVAGISRSASLVVAYLMKKQELSFNDAYEKISHRRPIINPNAGFVRQLKQYGLTLKIKKNTLRSLEKSSLEKVRINESTREKNRQKLNRSLGVSVKKGSMEDQIKEIQNNQLTLEYQIEQLRQKYLKSKVQTQSKEDLNNPEVSQQYFTNRKTRHSPKRQYVQKVYLH